MAGMSIAQAPIEALEAVSVGRHELPGALGRLALTAGGGVVLSTCNRTEVYSEAEDVSGGAARLRRFVADLAATNGRGAEVSQHVYVASGDAVARRLFRVASGLDSMALGEPQVAGQVAHALRASGEAGAVQPRVSRMFHAALKTSRRVREKTGLGRDRVSVPSIGVQMIERALGSLKDRHALLIGAGETGELVARALRTAGIGRLTVASRRPERAAALGAELAAAVVPFAYKEFAAADADVIVACTAAAEKPVLTRTAVEAAMQGRAARPLFILDAGMPRDVDPASAAVPGVTLRDLAGLEAVAAEHRASRRGAADQAEALIEREVARFMERLSGIEAEPVIRSLGSRAEAMRQAEVQRAIARMPGLSPEHAAVVEAMSRSIVNRILAEPISFVRESGEPEAVDALADVFDLDASGGA
jgi:glutamyl-tRNA reductase